MKSEGTYWKKITNLPTAVSSRVGAEAAVHRQNVLLTETQFWKAVKDFERMDEAHPDFGG